MLGVHHKKHQRQSVPRLPPKTANRPINLLHSCYAIHSIEFGDMGAAEPTLGVHPQEEEAFQPRKRFKTSELPLNATQRSTIDSLLYTIKKNGEYDALRKKVWSQFEDSVSNF